MYITITLYVSVWRPASGVYVYKDTDCCVEVPWLRVSTPGPALWAGRVVMQAVITLQVGDVRVRRVRVRHVAGRGTEVV
jgi:hypothetical protein